MVRSFTAEVLRQRGYTVIEAASGAEAIEVLEKREPPIHAMVTNVIMPHMSGKELPEKASVLCPGLRVLFISGYTADSLGHHGILEDGIAFLKKPFSPSDLLRKLREVIAATP